MAEAAPPQDQFKHDLHGTARWLLDPSALRLDALQAFDDGTIIVPVEVVRPGAVNQWNVTPQLVNELISQERADLVDDHFRDVDGVATGIGGMLQRARLEQGTGALIADLRTFKTPTGKDMAGLIIEHKAAVAEGHRGIVALSVGVRNLVFPDEEAPFAGDPPWDVIGGVWDHVMLTRFGYQAQAEAGIRATMDEAINAYLARGARFISGSGDDPLAMTTEAKLQAQIDELNAAAEKRAQEHDALKAKLDEATKAIEAATEATNAEKTRADELQATIDNGKRDALVASITEIHGKLGTDVPQVEREGGAKVDLKDATLAEVEPIHLAALTEFAANPPATSPRVPPREATPPANPAEAPPLKGLFSEVTPPNDNTNGGQS